MLRSLRYAVPAVSVFCALVAAEADVVRVVELRDGSRLRVPFRESDRFQLLGNPQGGEDARVEVPVSAVARISFSAEPALEKLTEIQEAVAGLGSEDFTAREKAQQALEEKARGFSAILEERSVSSGSAEIRWRLRRILQSLPKMRLPEYRLPYDIVRTTDGRVLEGDFGDWSMAVTYREQELVLNRENVLLIHEERASPAAAGMSAPASRVDSHEDAVFEGGRTIDFEIDPMGQRPEIGDDIAMRFSDWGVLFQTSVPGEFVSVNDYEVAGPSRGLSAATHEPLYEGAITVRFCVPGNPGVPAGVHAVGVWLAIVLPDGTTMQAFDARGNRIKEIHTLKGTSEFLGIRSAELIHSIRIIPNPDVDSNYTMDDLVFSKPQALDDVGVEGHSTARLRNGDRLICDTIENGANGESVLLQPVSFPGIGISVEKPELAALHMPLSKHRADDLPRGTFWAKLGGGSLVLVNERLELERFPGQKLEDLEMTVLWGRTRLLMDFPPGGELKRGEAIIVDGDSVRRVAFGGLGEKWIKTSGSEDLKEMRYETSPSVWISQRRGTVPGASFLTFPNGESILLQGGDGFRLVSFSADSVEIARGERRWSFPMKAVSELRFGAP